MILDEVKEILGTNAKLELTNPNMWSEDEYEDEDHVIGTIDHSDETYEWYLETDYYYMHLSLDFKDGILTNKYEYGLK